MVLFAALTFVSLVERGVPFWRRLLRSPSWSWCCSASPIERLVLRPLVNQPPITLFMATLGLSYVIEGFAQLLWGTQVHGLDLGIDDMPFEVCGHPRSASFDLFAAGIAAAHGRASLTVFFQLTRIGLAFRAVADDQFAALAVGLRLPRIWAHASGRRPGFVALVAGLLWGARLGVQFSLSLIVLKALPVLVLGGFDFDPRRHRRRPADRRQREAGRGLSRRLRRRRHRELVRLRAWRCWCCWCARPACSAEQPVERV